MSGSPQEYLGIGCSAPVVLHRNEGLCRRTFADIVVDKVCPGDAICGIRDTSFAWI